jgi:hypothetical protein
LPAARFVRLPVPGGPPLRPGGRLAPGASPGQMGVFTAILGAFHGMVCGVVPVARNHFRGGGPWPCPLPPQGDVPQRHLGERRLPPTPPLRRRCPGPPHSLALISRAPHRQSLAGDALEAQASCLPKKGTRHRVWRLRQSSVTLLPPLGTCRPHSTTSCGAPCCTRGGCGVTFASMLR